MKATKATKETKATNTKSNLLFIFARLSEVTCKKANLNNVNLTKVTKATYRDWETDRKSVV